MVEIGQVPDVRGYLRSSVWSVEVMTMYPTHDLSTALAEHQLRIDAASRRRLSAAAQQRRERRRLGSLRQLGERWQRRRSRPAALVPTTPVAAGS